MRKLNLDASRRGGLLGGPARASALSADRRSEIAKLAADSRWGRTASQCTCHRCPGPCFCTGACTRDCPVHGHPVNTEHAIPCPKAWANQKIKPGMQDDDEFPRPCNHREHEPPTMLYIPPGKKFVHVCP